MFSQTFGFVVVFYFLVDFLVFCDSHSHIMVGTPIKMRRRGRNYSKLQSNDRLKVSSNGAGGADLFELKITTF